MTLPGQHPTDLTVGRDAARLADLDRRLEALERQQIGQSVSLSSASSQQFNNLNGNTDYGYSFFLAGRLSMTTGTTTQITLQPIASGVGSNSRNVTQRAFLQPDDSTLATDLVRYNPDQWLHIIENTWAQTGDLVAHGTLVTNSNGRIAHECTTSWKAAVNVDARVMSERTAGFLYTQGTVTALKFNFDQQGVGATFSGVVAIRPLTA